MRTRALLSFQRDVAHMPITKLLACRMPLARPLHRFKGVMSLEEDCVLFEGKDTLSNRKLSLRICYADIEKMDIGYDKTFPRIRDKHLGIVTKPLRIKSKTRDGEVKTVYIFANFNRLLRTTQNRQWLNTIKRRI